MFSEELDIYLDGVLQDWKVPGMAVAAVAPSNSFSKGYGVRELGKSDPVTSETVFTIGSLTKAFSAVALGVLVDEGLVDWDGPVTDYLPSFQLADPYVSRVATIRDLLAHRVGWEEDYWRNFANRFGLSRQEIIRSLRHADCDGFRSRYVYSNMLYLVAGEIIPAVTGTSWDDFVDERILVPLGMRSTSTRAAALTAAGNHAMPHASDGEGRQYVDPIRIDAWWTMDNHGPSGSINASVSDLAAWLRSHLPRTRGGRPELVSEAVLREMHRPHMLTGDADDGANLSFGYGLGWRVGLYRGQRCSFHEGAFRGMSAYAALIHDRGFGVAVLANARDAVKGSLTRAVGQWILDRMLNAARRDWQSEYREVFVEAQREQAMIEAAWQSERASNTSPSLPLDGYAGCYHNSTSIGWNVELQQEGLTMRRISGTAPYLAALDHWHYDTFHSRWNDPLADYWPARFVSFSVNPTGQADALNFFDRPGGKGTRFARSR